VVNLLNLAEGEQITDCRAVKDFDQPGHFLVMATARGLVKKTPLAAYSRPLRSGLIAIKLRAGDELVDVDVVGPGDEILLATKKGMAIRFRQGAVRPMGRNTSGVKGIRLTAGDEVIGMVVADPEATLLTACANGYGKRTPFGPHAESEETEALEAAQEDDGEEEAAELTDETAAAENESPEGEEPEDRTSQRYRAQGRGGKGLHDIKTTPRNGPVIGIAAVRDEDEVLMITARGQIQRIPAADISIIGRNTQGVRIMSLDEGDTLVAVKRVPKEENGEGEG
jgi:DNA gyrase subunit A